MTMYRYRIACGFLACLGLIGCESSSSNKLNFSSNAQPIRFVHWNIKELDSSKLERQDQQVVSAANIIRQLKPQLVSINEIQFDVEKANNATKQANEYEWQKQQNMDLLLQSAFSDQYEWNITFAPANTGMRSKPDENGKYLSRQPRTPDDPLWDLVDQANFGLFPGQYSTGFATTFPISARLIVQDLTWMDWDPTIDLSSFDIGGVKADEYELFDKNFNVSWITIEGKELAVITFHTVPAFDFGNPLSPNKERNEAQLSFLEWFLLGQCETDSPSTIRSCKTKLRPLQAGTSFIAVGDFNVALDSDNPGAEVIKRILASELVHDRISEIPGKALEGVPHIKSHDTFFSSGWRLDYSPMQLDYFLVSSDLNIHRLETYFTNPQLMDHGCFSDFSEGDRLKEKLQKDSSRAVQSYVKRISDEERVLCIQTASAEFGELRNASDHFPLILDFSF